MIFVGMVALGNLGMAETLLDSYTARLGYRDHFSSHGERLSDPAAVIRQDRANFHRFHKRDSEDQYDNFFGSKSNRATMERMLNRGTITRSAWNAIVNGTPLVHVNIYRHHVDVELLSEYQQRSSIQ